MYLIEKDEAIQITISVIALSFAFGILFADIGGLIRYPLEFLMFMLPLLVTVGSGFILHEMAHKLAAIFYGASARFQMWTQGLILMLVTSSFGFLFAAPGAVYIYADRVSKEENGIISAVGPLVNITLALFFLLLQAVAPVTQYYSFLFGQVGGEGFGIVNGALSVWKFGAAINIILGLFNMIPAFPLDGSKVWRWSRLIWGGLVFIFLGMMFLFVGPIYVISWAIMLLVMLVLSKLIFG